GDLHQHRIARAQRLLDGAGLALQPGGLPVHLAGVEHRVAATADVHERRLHAGQHVLHLAQVDAAGHGVVVAAAHVVLDQDAVLQHRNLGTAVGPARRTGLADHHHPVHRLPPGEEFGFGKHRGAGAALVPAAAAALPLGFQAGGAGHPAYLVAGRAVATVARLTLLDHGGYAVVGLTLCRRPLTAAAALATATADRAAHGLEFFRLFGVTLQQLRHVICWYTVRLSTAGVLPSLRRWSPPAPAQCLRESRSPRWWWWWCSPDSLYPGPGHAGRGVGSGGE